jgi:hypothetical protein
LRGDTEYKDLDVTYLDELLEDVDRIDAVTFTGGEPFLNPRPILHFIEIVKENDIEVGSFYIATNGMVFENSTSEYVRKCLFILIELYLLMDDKENCMVQISTDHFHYGEITNNNMLYTLAFTSDKGDIEEQSLLPEGRGAYWNTIRRPPTTTWNYEYPDELMIYLNANGRVCWNCNLSYETQDDVSVSIRTARIVIKKCNKLYAKSVSKCKWID